MNRLIEGFKNKHGKIFYSITKVMFFILGMALPAKIIQGRFGDKMRSLAQGSSDTVKFMGLDVISIARGTNENASKYEISRNYLYIVIPLIMGIVFFIIYTKISLYFIKRFRMNNIENRNNLTTKVNHGKTNKNNKSSINKHTSKMIKKGK